MKENRNITGNNFSQRLPVHTPDDSLWDNIASGLDKIDAQMIYEERLQDLPVHQPDDSAWNLILRKMQLVRVVKISGYSLLAVAASILLLISLFRLPENKLNPSPGISAVSKEKPGSSGNQNRVTSKHANINSSASASGALSESKRTLNPQHPVKGTAGSESNSMLSYLQATDVVPVSGNKSDNIASSEVLIANDDLARNNRDIQLLAPNTKLASASGVKSLRRNAIQSKTFSNPSLLAIQPNAKYYTPEPYNPHQKKSNSFELAANYLPESLENGSGTSLFNNFGLMASLGNDKTRIQSSIGMTYNSEHRTFDVAYTHLIAITVPNPNSPTADSTYILPVKANSNNLDGTEKHQYLTYDLGIGKKLFSLGKMTTWVNTGAGFAVKLDQSSIKEQAINTVKGQQNTVVNSIDLEIPDYNKVNINLMAGLDFDYLVMDRLIISFAPTSRIYLKPVLEMNGSSTDSFSLGFRSGIKFKF
jgi:hypothetical protein